MEIIVISEKTEGWYTSFYEMAEDIFKWFLDYFDKNLWPIKDKYAKLKVVDYPNKNVWYEIDLVDLFIFEHDLNSEFFSI